MNIYVASSWRNFFQQPLVTLLRTAGFEVYDFKNPEPGNNGFTWDQIDNNWLGWNVDEYRKALIHPIAQKGFNLDMSAMKKADCCVLLLPCNRSAHLEAGWFIGQNKPVHILIEEDEFLPELMYLMANTINKSPKELLGSLGVKD